MPRSAVRTFLFADLRDYTAFVESRGDAQATRLLRAYRRIVRGEVLARKGAEIKTEGDSFYVVFELPGDAVRCAISIQRKARKHTQDQPGLPLRLGIGVNTGEAVEHDGGYVGAAVIVASRLSSQAPAGSVIVTDTVRGLLRTTAIAPMRDLGAWTLKGIAAPVRVYDVAVEAGTAQRALAPALRLPALLVPPTRGEGLVVCPELVQREIPLSALLQHIRAAAGGETRVVALTGEAGVGKSRLAREIAGQAHADGFYVFAGRSHVGAGLPYEPFVAALRGYASARGTEVLRRVLGPLVSELRRVLPEVDVGIVSESSIPDEERRERFFRTILLLLEDAAAQRPILLVLEDVHEADAASRELFLYLAMTMRIGICMVITYREDEVGPAHPLRALLLDLQRERRLAQLSLAPLDPAGVERMTAALLGKDATSELARVVHERSQGIPFYVEELLKTTVDASPGAPGQLALPRSVSDSVQLRLQRLVTERGPQIADLLQAAAVAGVPLDYPAFVRLSGRAEAEVDADLAASVDAQLLERLATRTESYQFRHALTREAIETAIPEPRRRRLHGRVAEALAATPRPEDERAALLAHHFAAAGNEQQAFRYAREGAARALRLGAYSTAVDLLQVAAESAPDDVGRLETLESLVHALQAGGRATEAEAALRTARELALADADRTAALDVRLADVLLMQGRRSEAMMAASRAAAALEGHEGPTLAAALVISARLSRVENDHERAVQLAERALAIARGCRERAIEASALTVLGSARVRLAGAKGVPDLEEAVAVAKAHDLGGELVVASVELVLALRSLGRWDTARAAAEEALTIARERGLEFAQARLLTELVHIHYTQGRYRDARDSAERAVAMSRQGTTLATVARSLLCTLLTLQGESEAAFALSEQIAIPIVAVEPDRRLGYLSTRARIFRALGDLDAAAEAASRAVEFVLSALPRAGVEAFLAAADVAEARRDGAELRRLMARCDAHFAGRESRPIAVMRAEMDAILADIEGRNAADAFARVAERYAELGVPVRAAYRHACAMIAAIRAQGSDLPDAPVRAIRAELVERGALYYVNIIDAALPSGAAPARTPHGATLSFSKVELRTAMLVSRGHTNDRIAAELGVTVDDAEDLVAAVLRKLGVASRAQVASWVLQREEGRPARP